MPEGPTQGTFYSPLPSGKSGPAAPPAATIRESYGRLCFYLLDLFGAASILVHERSRVGRRYEAVVQDLGFQPVQRRGVRAPGREAPGRHRSHGVRGVWHLGGEPDTADGQPCHWGHGENGCSASTSTNQLYDCIVPARHLIYHLLHLSLQGRVILDPDFDIFQEMGNLCKICKTISANKQLVKPGGAQCLPSGA